VLPEELQVHEYGISGEYDPLVASLSRIQKTLRKKAKQEGDVEGSSCGTGEWDFERSLP
jgi:hypothetical protein